MVTFLSGGTGTPKLLSGASSVFPPDETTVIGNTGDDIELGGHLVCPDIDTVLFLGSDMLDTDTWWGIEGDSAVTHEELQRLANSAGYSTEPRYLEEASQTAGRDIARWRRFSGVGEFMHIGDRDRAIHITRTGLLDEGCSLTTVIERLAAALEVPWRVLPMSDDPVATLLHTPDEMMHFQEFWVANNGEPDVESVEFRGSEEAVITDAVAQALEDAVVIGPSNPITSIGPMRAIDELARALQETPVVAVSPFIEDQLFSGPAEKLMRAMDYEPSTAGLARAYPFVDAFILDTEDSTNLDRPIVQTDTAMEDVTDAKRVATAVQDALEMVA